jgi:hypothetical protein
MTIVYSALNYKERTTVSFTPTMPFGFEAALFVNGSVGRSCLIEVILISVKLYRNTDREGNWSRNEHQKTKC